MATRQRQLLLILLSCASGTCETLIKRSHSSSTPAVHSTAPLLQAATPPAAPLRKDWVQRSQQLTVFTVGMALFNDVVLLLMIVPILPALSPSATDLQLAVLFSIKDVCQLICAPFAGALTLRCGARPLLAASLLGMAAATVAFAEANSFNQLLVARACQGIASAELMSGGLTLIAQTHEAGEERTAAMARAHSGLGLGATIGPVLGGLLFERLGRRATFYAAASLVLLNAIAFLVLNSVAPAPSVAGAKVHRADEPPLHQLLSLVRNRDIAVVAAGILAILAAGGVRPPGLEF